MKSVLISIQPKWCELIANGSKTIEVRKTKPKLDIPFKVYIYCTKDNAGLIPSRYWWKADKTGFQHILNGKVIGEFVCNCITSLKADNLIQSYYNNTQATCLTDSEIMRYANGGKLYYWHISDLVIYDKPRDLDYFRKPIDCHRGKYRENCIGCWDCEITRPPQSWCYVESKE